MKACVIQPKYSMEYTDAEKNVQWILDEMDKCDGSLDLIVLPESCDMPANTASREERDQCVARYRDALYNKARQTAARCGANVCINLRHPGEKGLINATYMFDRRGEIAALYKKQHTTPGECGYPEMDCGYTYEFEPPLVAEVDGVRYGFLTCYDFYFYEYYGQLARQDVDVIIGCTQQRTDSHEYTEVTCKFLAYNTNAYVVRASVCMNEGSDIGGGSMIVAPDMRVLANMESRVGMAAAEFDPKAKHYKPAGFGGDMTAHWQYIERGRRPMKYRPAGSAIVPDDSHMAYPRVCAHRGFSTIAPENSLPAFGAAVALGAQEIEFDLWPTRDGEIVSLHDDTLERVSDGEGKIWDKTYEELTRLDFGAKDSEPFRGLRVVTFEDILKKLACHTVMNVHVKTRDDESPYDIKTLRKILDLIEKYDCRKYCYFMTSNDTFLAQIGETAPGFCRCVGESSQHFEIVNRAIRLGCEKVQLFKPYFNQEMIDKAHDHGILCNVFWSDDPQEARRFLDMGIDTILSNDYLKVARAVEAWKRERK